jgi:hypothetical protein
MTGHQERRGGEERFNMETEEPDDDPQIDASEVWNRLSEERRERALDLLTRMAYRYVKSQTAAAEEEAEGEGPSHIE